MNISVSNDNNTVGYVAMYLQILHQLNLKVPSEQLDNGQEETGEYSKQIREPQVIQKMFTGWSIPLKKSVHKDACERMLWAKKSSYK